MPNMDIYQLRTKTRGQYLGLASEIYIPSRHRTSTTEVLAVSVHPKLCTEFSKLSRPYTSWKGMLSGE